MYVDSGFCRKYRTLTAHNTARSIFDCTWIYCKSLVGAKTIMRLRTLGVFTTRKTENNSRGYPRLYALEASWCLPSPPCGHCAMCAHLTLQGRSSPCPAAAGLPPRAHLWCTGRRRPTSGRTVFSATDTLTRDQKHTINDGDGEKRNFTHPICYQVGSNPNVIGAVAALSGQRALQHISVTEAEEREKLCIVNKNS